jgi:hypothetical protein
MAVGEADCVGEVGIAGDGVLAAVVGVVVVGAQ